MPDRGEGVVDTQHNETCINTCIYNILAKYIPCSKLASELAVCYCPIHMLQSV
jgi:Zn-finger protein